MLKHLLRACIAIIIVTMNACNQGRQVDIIIANVNIIDVEKGEVVKSRDVIVNGDKITRILQHGEGNYSSLKQIDASGQYLIPGLSDMHVHTGAREVFFPLYIAHGITGIRDMGGDLEQPTGNFSILLDSLVKWRNQVREDKILGPRIYRITGPLIDGPDQIWPQTYPVASEEEARKKARSVIKRGGDFIKVYSGLPRNLYLTLVEEGKDLGVPFLGHVPNSVEAMEAAKLGQKSMEHMNRVFTPYRNADQKDLNNLFQTFIENNSWQVPTLAVYRFKNRDGSGDFLDDPRLKYMPQHIRTKWDSSAWWHNPKSPLEVQEDKKEWQARCNFVHKMQEAGVPLLAGSDSANPYTFPGSGLHDELQFMVDGGLTSLEALQTATINPARYLNREDSLGVVKEGNIADLVLLGENPLENIQNTRTIRGIVLDGKWLNREYLDALLKQAASKVQEKN